jgi:hypothetical protein
VIELLDSGSESDGAPPPPKKKRRAAPKPKPPRKSVDGVVDLCDDSDDEPPHDEPTPAGRKGEVEVDLCGDSDSSDSSDALPPPPRRKASPRPPPRRPPPSRTYDVLGDGSDSDGDYVQPHEPPRRLPQVLPRGPRRGGGGGGGWGGGIAGWGGGGGGGEMDRALAASLRDARAPDPVREAELESNREVVQEQNSAYEVSAQGTGEGRAKRARWRQRARIVKQG